MSHVSQLTLPFAVDEAFDFDQFIEAQNRPLIRHLKRQINHHHESSTQNLLNSEFLGIFIHGTSSTGKSHVLAGLARLALNQDLPIAYLHHPNQMNAASHFPDIKSINFLDDVESFTTDIDSERHLLSLIEKVKHDKGLLLISASCAASQLNITLADLKSRLNAMDNFELHELDDKHKRQALQQRAQLFGFTLSREVCNWLFTHTSRNLGTLMALLDQIDTVSLSEKRKVTIPLVKKILADSLPN